MTHLTRVIGIFASLPKSTEDSGFFRMNVLPSVSIDHPDFPVSSLKSQTLKIPDNGSPAPGNTGDGNSPVTPSNPPASQKLNSSQGSHYLVF